MERLMKDWEGHKGQKGCDGMDGDGKNGKDTKGMGNAERRFEE